MKTVSSLRKLIVVLPGSVLIYLLHACVMERLPIFGVTGNILWAFLSIIIVSCGKKSAFCASAIIGMLMESMLSSVNGLYVICYPIITMAWSMVFSDMNDRQRERRLVLHPDKRQEDLPAVIRILLAAACMDFTMHTVQLAYMYLTGNPLTFGHFFRALLSVLYTELLALVMMVPIRHLLGMYKKPKSRFQGGDMQ